MTSKDVEGELLREPFVPLKLHLVSGKTVNIGWPGMAWLLQNSILVFQNTRPGLPRAEGYDVIALRNIERIEQLVRRSRSVSKN